MASKRLRSSGSWEYCIRRKSLPRPLYLTFDDEAEGDAFVERLEREIDAGIIPADLTALENRVKVDTIAEAIKAYRSVISVPDSDDRLLDTLSKTVGRVQLAVVNFDWVQDWITRMKREDVLAPSTIRHYVGALGRCFDWIANKRIGGMAINPIRLLPGRYAVYAEEDIRAVRINGKEPKEDEIRDRRLEPAERGRASEEDRIRAIMAGVKPENRQRPLELNYQAALECLFDLAVETAMRLREMFTLTRDQVDVAKRTVFLDKTKNGNKRQVPLSSVAVAALTRYFKHVRDGTRGMEGFEIEAVNPAEPWSGRIFPWWNGDLDQAELRRVTSLLSKQFARIFDAAGCDDLTFHDLRHEATSRFYERTDLSDNEIMKIVGNTGAAHKRYVNLRASDLATKLW